MEFNVFQDKKPLEAVQTSEDWVLYKFDEVLEDDTKSACKIKKENYLQQGKYPIVDQGQTYIAGYTDDVEGLYDTKGIIIFGDHTRAIKYIDFPLYIGADGVKLLRSKLNQDALNMKYLYYFLKTIKLPNDGYSRHFKYLKQIVIPLPKKHIQDQIVQTLDKAQEIINKREQQIEVCDEIIKSQFIEMFGDPFVNPKGFEIIRFEQLVEYMGDIGSNGANSVVSANLVMSDTEDYALMVRTTNFTNNDFVNNVKYVSKEVYDFFKKSKVYGGELIFNKIGSAGINFVMPNLNRPVSLGLNQIMVRTNDKVCMTYLHNLLNTDYGKQQISSRVQGAVTKSITKGAIKELPILLPPLELQNKFAEFVQQVDKLKFEMQKSLEELENNFNALMQKAFKGELF